MSYRKQGLGLVGLLAVIALVVAAFASSAQALTPKFLVGKKAVAAGLNAVVEGKQIGRSTLLVPALNTEFNCEKFRIINGLLESGTTATGELKYEECTVLELKTPLGEIPCTVKNGKTITAKGTILPTETITGEPALLVEAINGLIGLEGPECPLPLDIIIKGELCLKIVNNDTVKPKVQSSEAIQKSCKERTTLEGATEGAGFKDKLLFGVQEGFIDSEAELFLGGAAHTGLTLGVSLQ
jgi:hypothetical protein